MSNQSQEKLAPNLNVIELSLRDSPVYSTEARIKQELLRLRSSRAARATLSELITAPAYLNPPPKESVVTPTEHLERTEINPEEFDKQNESPGSSFESSSNINMPSPNHGSVGPHCSFDNEPKAPKRRKSKTELDLLYEDINKMSIRDEELSATRKRTWCMLRSDKESNPQAALVLCRQAVKTKPNCSKETGKDPTPAPVKSLIESSATVSEFIPSPISTPNIKPLVRKGVVNAKKRAQKWKFGVIPKAKKRKSNLATPITPAVEEQQPSNVNQTTMDCKTSHTNNNWNSVNGICKQNVNSAETVSTYNHLDVHKNDSEREVTEMKIVNNTVESGSIATYPSHATTTTPLQPSTSGYNLPMLSPVSKPSTEASAILPDNIRAPSSKRRKIMLKETPLSPGELIKSRKSQFAQNEFLIECKIVHLYKCPEHDCTYSTDLKQHFKFHLNQHKDFKLGMQITCLYCNFKTDFEYFSVHYDTKHGHCRYCCAYCLYRAINQSYVEMHQEREHFGKPRRVLIARVNQDTLTSRANVKTPTLKEIIPVLRCGQRGCASMFLFHGEFITHLNTAHKGALIICFECKKTLADPDNVIIHMKTHCIQMYHCRYCGFDDESLDEIYKHLSHQHFARKPQIICRLPDAGTSTASYTTYGNDDPKSFERLKLITNENQKYISGDALYHVKSS